MSKRTFTKRYRTHEIREDEVAKKTVITDTPRENPLPAQPRKRIDLGDGKYILVAPGEAVNVHKRIKKGLVLSD